MTDTRDLARFRLPATLCGGRPVVIRTARADDEERLNLAFDPLHPQTITDLDANPGAQA